MSQSSAASRLSFAKGLFPPSWRLIGLTAAALLLFLSAVLTLDQVWQEFWSAGIWGRLLTAPTIIVYILIIGRLLVPFQKKALQSLRQISALDDKAYQELLQQSAQKMNRGALPALVFGFLFGFIPSLPFLYGDDWAWIHFYLPLVSGVMFALLAFAIQQAIAEGYLNSRLLQGPLNFDIFYTAPFIPIGLQGLAVALAFVGGSTIVVFFSAVGRYGFTLVDIVFHSLLIAITLFIFFMTLRPAHKVLRDAKLAEQDNLRRQMARAYRRLEAMTLQERENILPFSTEVSLWQQYEKRLNEVPTWPYNAGIMRTLFASILLPVMVTLGQRLMAMIMQELGIQ